MRIITLLPLAGLLAVATAHAGEPWLAPGNSQARHDIQLLVDEGVINLPMSGWPIAVSDLAAALSRVPSPQSAPAKPGEVDLTPAQSAAIARLRKLASEGRPVLGVEVRAAAGPMVLRTFDDEAREEGELTGYAAGFVGDRWGGRLELTVAADPDDDEVFRSGVLTGILRTREWTSGH